MIFSKIPKNKKYPQNTEKQKIQQKVMSGGLK
jgi:hypothetical protein